MKYRREVDGLRAVAVIPVILFHAGFAAFSGGFVGVDVFFVISGYLITSKILDEQETGTFSLAGFYERRARRILPAFFVVLAACLAGAWLFLLPDDMKSFSESLVAVNVVASNIFFYRDTNYFAPDAALKPLLHTWSVAVEEQYYLLYPFFLMVTWRLGKRSMAGLLTVAAVLSLAVSQWGSLTHPRFTFFMLHTRAWELLVGALVAFFLFPKEHGHADVDARLGRPVRQMAAAAGLALITYAVCAFDTRTPSPSLYTLVPVIGAALIILFATGPTLVGRLLGTRWLVGIGLVSYSAYLWHHPLFAFARYRSVDEPPTAVLLALAVAAIALAYLSWKYVETPFRNKQRFTRRQVFTSGAIVGVVFVAIGLLGHFSDGFYRRFSSAEVRVLKYSHYDYKRAYRAGVCFLDETETLPFGTACQASSAGPSTLIWGDSHAAALSAGLRRALPNVIQYTASRCLPLKDVSLPDRPDCRRINDFVAGEVQRVRPQQIYLHADWRRGKELDPVRNIRRTIDFVRSVSPATLITIVGGVPQWHPSLPILMFRRHAALDDATFLQSSVFGEIAAFDDAFGRVAKDEGVTFFSSIGALCQGDRCQATAALDGTVMPTAWDYGHLTEGGSALLAERLVNRRADGRQ